MRDTTTIRLSRSARDELRELAVEDGVTLDVQVRRLVRAERQRRMGAALGERELGQDEQAWIDRGAATVADDARR